MNGFRGVIKMYIRETKISFAIFWSVILAITVLATFFSVMNAEGSFTIGATIGVYVFLLVFGLSIVKEIYPYAIGMGSTRKAYFWGSTIIILFLSIITAILQNMLTLSTNVILGMLDTGVTFNLTFASLFVSGIGLWQSMLVDVCIACCILTVFHAISCIDFRFGLIPLGILGLLLVSIFVTTGARDWAGVGLIEWIIGEGWVSRLSVFLLSQAVIFHLISWLILRKAPIVSARGN